MEAEGTQLMAVAAATETKLRDAMTRLLGGTAMRTDGALTKENLAREAGVSHATVHRATAICEEWDARVARPVLRTPGEVRRDSELADLRDKLTKANGQITELHGKLDALATVTANLYHENQTLRRKLDQRGRLAVLPSN
jgi:small-conductance mechanosensitive channel